MSGIADSVVRNRVILVEWTHEMLRITKPGGLIQTTIHSPLTVEDLAEIMGEVVRWPSYEGQRIALYAHDGTPVTVVEGRVIIGV